MKDVNKKKTNWKRTGMIAGALTLCTIAACAGMVFSLRPTQKTHAQTPSIPSPSESEARKEAIEMQTSAYRQMLAERSKAEAEKAREADIKKSETSHAQKKNKQPSQVSKASKAISQPSTTYSYDGMDRTMYTTISLSVRSQPEKSGNRIGTLSNGTGVHVTGKCQQTGWYRIDYNDKTGYVSDRYMSDSKPQSQPSPVSNADRTFSTSGVRYSWTSHGSTQRDVDNGYIIQYTDDYFAADIKTFMGKQIRSLKKGDIVSINGRKVMIDGEVYDNYNTGSVENGRKKIEAKGYEYNSVCFQTCIPPYHGPIVIKFGHYV